MNKNDLRDIGIYGAGGMVVAAIFGVINLAVKKKQGGKLAIPTEAIQQHKAMQVLLLDIEKHTKMIDEIAYLRAVDAIDRLVFLRFQIEEKKIEPTLTDRIEGFQHFKRAQQALQRLVRAIETTLPPKACVEAQTLIKRLIPLIETHLETIMLLTN